MSTYETYDASSNGFRRMKVWLWVAGVVTIVLGAIGIVFPFVMTLAAELLFGGLLAVLGLLQITRAIVNGGVESRLWTFLFGFIGLAAGALLLLYPLEGAVTLTIILASFFIIGGAIKLWGAWQIRSAAPRELPRLDGWGWLMLSGFLSLGIGALLFLGLPTTAIWALGLLLGLDLLFLGISEIALAIGLSRIAER